MTRTNPSPDAEVVITTPARPVTITHGDGDEVMSCEGPVAEIRAWLAEVEAKLDAGDFRTIPPDRA